MMRNDGFRSTQTKGDQLRRGGRRPMRPFGLPSGPLPPYVDLRRWMTSIEDQGQISSCTANAFAGICEYMLKRRTGQHIDVSRLFIYYNGRMLQNQSLVVEDKGVSNEHAALGLRKFGVCLEDAWPYYPGFMNTQPPPDAYAAAREITVTPLKVPRNLVAMKTCLANQMPFTLGIRLDQDEANIEVKENSGYISMPDPNDPAVQAIGTHAVVVVGYNDRSGHFLVRNSWGNNWGLEGYFYVPYQYLLEKGLVNFRDGAWAIKDMTIRSGYLSSVQQLVVPGHSHDARRRQMMMRQGQHHEKQHRHMMGPNHHYDERHRHMMIPNNHHDGLHRHTMIPNHHYDERHRDHQHHHFPSRNQHRFW